MIRNIWIESALAFERVLAPFQGARFLCVGVPVVAPASRDRPPANSFQAFGLSFEPGGFRYWRGVRPANGWQVSGLPPENEQVSVAPSETLSILEEGRNPEGFSHVAGG